MNEATQEGQPKFIVRDIPAVSDAGMVDVTQPRIYYGEFTNDHVIVNTKLKEIDYSEGRPMLSFPMTGRGDQSRLAEPGAVFRNVRRL